MKKVIVITVILALVVCGIILSWSPPRLNVRLAATEGRPVQRVRAIQGGASWTGIGIAFHSDSPHPLQLSPDELAAVTLYLNGVDGEIRLAFRGGFPPTSVYAVRWRAEYATGTQPSSDMFESWESVEVDGRTIRISNDGEDYIYEIAAHWPIANSFASYTFRVMSGSE